MTIDQSTILIIAPPGRLRDSIFVLLKSEKEFTLLGPADDAPAGLRMITAQNPSVVIVDANLPDGAAWDFLPKLKNLASPPHCLVLVHTTDQQQQAQTASADATLLTGFTTATLIATLGTLLPTPLRGAPS